MNANQNILKKAARIKLVTILLVSVSAVAAFATLGDGKSKGNKPSLLNNKAVITPGRFSLKSGYQYRGSQIINQQSANDKVTFNSLVTYQKGNMTYILPVKTVISKNVKLSFGIPQLGKN